VAATNEIGTSEYSSLNADGALVETTPQAPLPVTRGTDTSFDTI
jgi:hypothetical protein